MWVCIKEPIIKKLILWNWKVQLCYNVAGTGAIKKAGPAAIKMIDDKIDQIDETKFKTKNTLINPTGNHHS